jgi:hypothetical protein
MDLINGIDTELYMFILENDSVEKATFIDNVVKGDVDNGLIFCGANVGRINEITTVHSLMKELTE